ncbi:phage repressor protein CI [Pantoea agglomerans]|uniref:phage repressor protein CI n=1 Tax=Enterobacter agglomerans TaxID=549 RepID=UPI003209BA3C
MPNLESNAQEVIERLLSAYGVTTQRALAEALKVPSNNVSAWSQRNSVPGSAIIKCVLDTGVDLQWLLNGKIANASSERAENLPSGEALLKEITSNGGKAVLRRIMDAYGFTLQKQLCDLLGISSGTVSTWVRRNYFPGDVVVTCALDTGVSLRWIALGKDVGNIAKNNIDNGNEIPKKHLSAGVLHDVGFWKVDVATIAPNIKIPFLLTSNHEGWLVDESITEISNGKFLIKLGGKLDVYDVILLPRNRLKATNKKGSFECALEEILVEGMVVISMEMFG